MAYKAILKQLVIQVLDGDPEGLLQMQELYDTLVVPDVILDVIGLTEGASFTDIKKHLPHATDEAIQVQLNFLLSRNFITEASSGSKTYYLPGTETLQVIKEFSPEQVVLEA